MSTTGCNRCGELISFVQHNGRWRPVEASYTVLELEQDEVITLRFEGAWQAQPQSELRVFTFHTCPEDPSLRRGPARTRVVGAELDEAPAVLVDVATGEVLDDDYDDEPTPQQVSAYQQRWIDGARDRVPRTQIGSDCPVCPGKAGEPCQNVHGHVRGTTHSQRGWVTAFGDDEPWPPDPRQRGYAVMQRWLRENQSIFATPKEQ